MYSNYVHVIGVMSGTSTDGLDLCLVKFDKSNHSNYKIINTCTYNYSKSWISKLKNSIYLNEKELKKLDIEFGNYIGDKINTFMRRCGKVKIDLISSHGHTIFHKPDQGITLQIGNGESILQKTKCIVVCDFRTQDVKLGGQGAPLVPIGDLNLFGEYKYCLNIGGFCNISVKKNKTIDAFDISPVNTVLNYYSNKLGYDFDINGNLSKKGNVNSLLLNDLNKMDYYKISGPKSLGIEYVNEKVIPLIKSYSINNYDILKTYIEHVSDQIKKSINEKKDDKILITGGGVFNKTLIQKIRDKIICQVIIPEKEIIEHKESIIFAYLGLLKYLNRINCLSNVTGANKDHSSGIIYKF
jgi:anhydro-N-acetylmuramic acid kinase